jgi:phage internal scaffolding protein
MANVKLNYKVAGLYYPDEGIECPDEGLVVQSAKDECDINVIMKKYERDGLLEHVNEYEGHYGDFTEVCDYHTALNLVKSADEMFMTLPAYVRKEFDNDAGKFLEFVDDPANLDKMIEMGLAKAPEVTPQSPVDLGSEAKSEGSTI